MNDPTIQNLAAAEITVMLKDSLPNADAACLTVTPGSFWANSVCTVTGSKQKVTASCATKKQNLPNTGDITDLWRISISPEPSLYSLITANQDNGTVIQILTDNCNLADQQGHAIKQSKVCEDGDLTIRRLEGDVNGDCNVNIVDQQLLAFRWGIGFGHNLFDQQYDLVDTGDLQIDIKDVQFVFGRHGSQCENQNRLGATGPANPPQPPLGPK